MPNSVAIVTGASQGIGKATALRLARDFSSLTLVARDEEHLQETAQQAKSLGAESLVLAFDLREAAAAENIVTETLGRLGRIDALVNIAGAVPQIDLFEMTDAQWDDGMALKFHGARRLTIRAWDALKASKGSVVLLSGLAAYDPKPEFAAVAATNAAIIALAKAFAEQGIKDGVQVNSVSPGAVMTGRRQSFFRNGRPRTMCPSIKRSRNIRKNPASLDLVSRKRLRTFWPSWCQRKRSGSPELHCEWTAANSKEFDRKLGLYCAAGNASPLQRSRSMMNHISHLGGFGCVALLAVANTVLSCAVAAQQVPENLRPPANEQLLFRLHAKGDQVYICKGEAGQVAWTLKAPDAQLFDQDGKPFGKHFAGPSWEANDGSRVTGKAVANAPSPDADSIPWLLVNIVSHEGNGVLSRATTIQRLNTKGGKSPASGCDGSHSGGEVRVPYSADYHFYAPK